MNGKFLFFLNIAFCLKFPVSAEKTKGSLDTDRIISWENCKQWKKMF